MNDRHLRAIHLPAWGLYFLVVGLLLAPNPATAEYLVVPGSTGNAVHLAVDCPQAWSVAAELVSHPAWMTHLALEYAPLESGPSVSVRFDVNPAARLGDSGTLLLALTARDPRSHTSADRNVAGPALRRLPLRLAAAAPEVQSSYRIDECCLASAGIDGALDGLPDRPVLLGSAPNPWSSRTAIRFGLPASGSVTLRILNVAGRLQREIRLSDLAPGYHQIPSDGRDPDGQRVPPGLYFYELSSDRWVTTGKTLLLR
jgi:hypothetical protein